MDIARFDGRVAVVTGGGRGMGRHHCLLLADRGAAVVVNDLGGSVDGDGADAGPANEVAKEIVVRGGNALANADSVATSSGAAAVIASAVEAFGRIDIVVTNAGIISHAPFGDLDVDDIKMLLDVHTLGTWGILRAAWPHFLEQNYGRAVCINSSAGLYGMENVSAYSAAKGAIVGIVRSLSLEGNRHGIHVNGLAPGGRSRMSAATDPKSVAFAEQHMLPEFVSPAVAFLAHENCDVSGRLFTCIGHRMSEVVLSETCGLSLDPAKWSIESIRDGWSQVVDRTGTYEPVSAEDSVRFAYERMGVEVNH